MQGIRNTLDIMRKNILNKHLPHRHVSVFRCFAFLVSIVLIGGCSSGGSGAPPAILSVSPEHRAANVSVATSISVAFSEAMNTSSAEGAFSINPKVSGAFSWDAGNTVMTFTPSGDLADGTQRYTCTVGTAAQDIAGNALPAPYQWNWTTWSNAVANLLDDSNYDCGYSITTDPSGNLYLTGMFAGTADFAVYFGKNDPKTSFGSSDIFVTRINADGTYAWTKRIGGSDDEGTHIIETDPAGNVYLAGSFNGTVDFGADFGTSDIKISSGSSDSFVTRINADGTYEWTKQDYDPDTLPVSPLLRGSTYRHIYNNSASSIEFKAGGIAGNVYFLNCPKGNVKNGPCTLPPHSSIEYEFTRAAGASIGSIDINIQGCSDPICCKPSIGFQQHWGSGGFKFGSYASPAAYFVFDRPAQLDIKVTDKPNGCSFYK